MAQRDLPYCIALLGWQWGGFLESSSITSELQDSIGMVRHALVVWECKAVQRQHTNYEGVKVWVTIMMKRCWFKMEIQSLCQLQACCYSGPFTSPVIQVFWQNKWEKFLCTQGTQVKWVWILPIKTRPHTNSQICNHVNVQQVRPKPNFHRNLLTNGFEVTFFLLTSAIINIVAHRPIKSDSKFNHMQTSKFPSLFCVHYWLVN